MTQQTKAIISDPTSSIGYLDQLTSGWHALDVMRAGDGRTWDWVALMVDVHPDDLETLHRAGGLARERWFRIPGKHRNKDAARDALQDLIATRH